MSIYVDKLLPVALTKKWKWPERCHMYADSFGELMDFAVELDLNEDWVQTEPIPHFNLSAKKRELAIQKGAKPVQPSDVYALIQKWRAEGRIVQR